MENKTGSKNLPDYELFVKCGEKRWHKIGAGWTKENGEVSISLEALPISPTLYLAKRKETDKGKREFNGFV